MEKNDLFQQFSDRQEKRASRLLGRSDEARLGWLLKFSEIQSFKGLSQSKFRPVRRGIHAFTSARSTSYETVDHPLSPETAAQLAAFLKDGLQAFAIGLSWDLPSMSIARSIIPGDTRPRYNGRWNDMFLMAAADVLQKVGDRLRTCAAAGCDRLFVKRKRRVFCSERCSGAERMRRFQKDAKRYKAKRRAYYLKSKRAQAIARSGPSAF